MRMVQPLSPARSAPTTRSGGLPRGRAQPADPQGTVHPASWKGAHRGGMHAAPGCSRSGDVYLRTAGPSPRRPAPRHGGVPGGGTGGGGRGCGFRAWRATPASLQGESATDGPAAQGLAGPSGSVRGGCLQGAAVLRPVRQPPLSSARRRWLARWMDEAGVWPVSPHGLRRTFGTQLCQRTRDVL